jgi:hypothetical protein
MIKYTFNREFGPAKSPGPDVNKCCEKANPWAVGRMAPPPLFRRCKTRLALHFNKHHIQELLVPYFCAMV